MNIHFLSIEEVQKIHKQLINTFGGLHGLIDLEQGQEQQLNLFLQQHQLELSEFVKRAILDKLTQDA